jgi:hypothetical protein
MRNLFWALTSNGAGAGKSTFLGANAPRPICVVDTDRRFSYVDKLGEGEIVYADVKDYIEPLALDEWLTANAGMPTLIVDSLTKLYSIHARRAAMKVRQMNVDKAKGNRAALMVAKSDVMSLVRNAAALFDNVFYVWHKTAGIDGTGQEEIRDMVSGIELDRLDTSINVWLDFARDNKGFSVTVANARDMAGRPANTGFTIYDYPGNYWRGGAERLYNLIYLPFSGKGEAISWAVKRLNHQDQAEVEAVYDQVKERAKPEKPSEMWVAWVEHVEKLFAERKS